MYYLTKKLRSYWKNITTFAFQWLVIFSFFSPLFKQLYTDSSEYIENTGIETDDFTMIDYNYQKSNDL